MQYDPVEFAYSKPLNDVCIEINDYVLTAIPERIWQEAECIYIHCGLYAEHKLLIDIPNILSSVEIKRPHPNLQERFFSVGNDALISNVIGNTRLIHNLILLRLLGVKRNRIHVILQQLDFSEEYKYILNSITQGEPIQRVIFSFNRKSILDILQKNFKQKPEIVQWAGSLLKAIWLKFFQNNTLLVHITSVYGEQIVPFLEVLNKSFGLQEILIFGACGALTKDINLHDTVFVRCIVDYSGKILVKDNLLASVVSEYPRGLSGFHKSHIEDVTSVYCIPGETRSDLQQLAHKGVAAVDLELLPLIQFLSQYPHIRWGALLHVSDRPLLIREQIGTIDILEDTCQARQNEINNQVKIAFSKYKSLIVRSVIKQSFSWQLVSEVRPISIHETVLYSREGEPITMHIALISLDMFSLATAVNPVGQSYVWKDEIVRGMSKWDQQHMAHMNDFFRKNPQQYLNEYIDVNSVVTILNGNGNLYWNLGHFVYTNGKLFHHFRERFSGPQTALVKDTSGVRIGTVDVTSLGKDVEFALSGCRIIRLGAPVDILSIDPETNRPVLSEFYGDLTHVLKGFRLSLSLSKHLFEDLSQVVHFSGHSYYAKAEQISDLLMDAVCGHPITCTLSSDDEVADIHKNMKQYGYKQMSWKEHLLPGSFAIYRDRVLAIAYCRATLGHSLIASTKDPQIFLFVNTYTNSSRKGFILEDIARLVVQASASLGHCVQDALLISSSGDPRIILRKGKELVCLKRNKYGEVLLFKGGLEYGLSNILMVLKKK